MTNGLAGFWQFLPGNGQRHYGLGSKTGSRVATRLLWLIVAVAVPLLSLSTLAIWRVHESEQAVEEAALLEQARSMAQLFDREFERVETALLALATSASLSFGDIEGVETEMRARLVRKARFDLRVAKAENAGEREVHDQAREVRGAERRIERRDAEDEARGRAKRRSRARRRDLCREQNDTGENTESDAFGRGAFRVRGEHDARRSIDRADERPP